MLAKGQGGPMSEDMMNVLQRLASLETEFKNHSVQNGINHQETIRTLTELKQGLGIRVEQHGEKLAVLNEVTKVIGKDIDDLKDTRKKVTWAIISSVLLSILSLLGLRK